MHQQINLYQPVFRKQQKVFSSLTLLQICAVVLLLLAVIAAHTHWTLAGMETAAQNLEQQRKDLATRMGVLEDTYRTPDTDAIDSEIAALQKSIDQRNYLLQQFDKLVLRNRGGFAARFETLARLQVPGLWLEGVTVNDDRQMEIRGMTLDPKLVPVYLQQLEQDGGLSGASFKAVSMARVANDQPYVQFVLRNVAEGSTWQ
jgi:Fimbrial assembly protein (PilN)